MFRKIIHSLAAISTVLALSTGLSACNTMTGVGKDVEAGGQKIQDESKEAEHKM